MASKNYEGLDYAHFWRSPGKQYLDRLERRIVEHSLAGGESIADIAAGFGRLGPCYLDRYTHCHMVEPASNLRALARQAHDGRASFHDASVYDLPFEDSSLDAVLMIRLFHHLAEPESAMREVNRVLKHGGQLILSFSNKRNASRIARFAVGRANNPFTGPPELYQGALYGYHPAHVSALLGTLGFAIEKEYGVGVVDKVIDWMPGLLTILHPSLLASRLLGRARLAPYQFLIGRKRWTS